MKFKTIAEAFNHYRTMSVEDMEKRAKEINDLIDTDASADLEALNIELKGIKEARENAEMRASAAQTYNFITGMHTGRPSFEATEGDIVASPEYRSAFFKRLLGRELNEGETAAWKKAQDEKRADAYSTVSEVAGVIPTQTLNEVISKARTMGGVLANCRAFNIPAKTRIPVGTPLSAAEWNEEGTAVESGEPSIYYVEFGNYEIIKVLSISASVRKMSVPAFESYLTTELNSNVMATLANGVINGTGSAQGTGLEKGITWDGTNSVTFTGSTNTKLAWDDLVKAMALLKRGYANGAKFAMNNATLYNHVYSLMDNNKRPVFIQDTQTDRVGKILGFEVIVDDYIPDDTIYFGNFQYMGYNMVDGIAVEASTQSSFKSGRIDYRGMCIADCKPIVTEAFVKLSKASE